ncbi:hypothetical protein SeLEV6574_g02476 [Synchytrium endobioticum]|nr:hypothetical protein SeLEV6574_g02476 [Synchytrium endobioticum]
MFFQKRARKYWFTRTEEEVCWEQWTLSVTVGTARSEREQIEARRALEPEIEAHLMRISLRTNEHKDHVPPITNNDTYPFPFQISVSSHSDSTWSGLFKAYLPS